MMKFSAGRDRAVVSVGSVSDGFNLYLPRSGSLSNVASVLLAVAPRLRQDRFESGEVVCDFVAAVSPAVRCQMIARSSLALDFYPRADAQVVLTCPPLKGYTVSAFDIRDGVMAEKPSFDGPLQAFADWAHKLTGLEVAVKKVVKFKYMGGSRPGAIRTVRVDSVIRVEDAVHIQGVDLEKDDLNEGHRRFSSEKIEGEVTVLN